MRSLHQVFLVQPTLKNSLLGNRRHAAPPLLTGNLGRIAPTVHRLRLDSPVRNLQNIGFIRSQFHDAVSKYSPPLFVRTFAKMVWVLRKQPSYRSWVGHPPLLSSTYARFQGGKRQSNYHSP